MKLKTLKDFEDMQVHEDGTPCILVFPLIKKEAIKWVKEEKDLFGITPETKRWMKRLNITEDELK